MAPALLGIDHVHVYVRDRAAAEKWYEITLGLTRTKELEFWSAGGGPLTIQDKDATVHIALFERTHQDTRSTIALRVSGRQFGAWRAHLKAAPALEVTEEDHEVSVSLYFSDPDGNPYEITTYERQSARAEGDA
jgi:catechol-2,3-dioxygenase